jgi:hypothetical protein
MLLIAPNAPPTLVAFLNAWALPAILLTDRATLPAEFIARWAPFDSVLRAPVILVRLILAPFVNYLVDKIIYIHYNVLNHGVI